MTIHKSESATALPSTHGRAGLHVPPRDPDEFRLIDLYRFIKRERRIICASAAAGVLIAVVVALNITPMYRAEILLAPTAVDNRNTQLPGAFGGAARIVGISLPGEAGVTKTAEAIAVLTSRRFTEQFLEEEKLLPVLLGDAGEGGGAFDWLWGASSPTPIDASSSGTSARAMWDAYRAFSGLRTVTLDENTALVTLAVEWKEPDLAAQWANRLVARLNAERRQSVIDESEENLQYLSSQVAITSNNEMRELLFSLIGEETKTKMIANSREDFSFKVIDPAVSPQNRSKPRRTLIVVVGLLLGLLFGAFWALMRNFIDRNAASYH